MKITAKAARIALVGIILAAGSCVDLTGQRITLSYDASKDELLVLIHYDGIHENRERNDRAGAQQIPEFIKNGDIMFLDWPGHLQMEEVRAFARNDTSPPALAALAGAVAINVKSLPVGRYLDPDGRIGAAQLVVVSNAKEVVKKANAALNAAILATGGRDGRPDEAPAEWRMTVERMRAGAAQGRQWLSIEGHSLRFEFPAHPSEWKRNKFEAVKGFCNRWAELQRQAKPSEEDPCLLLQLLTCSVSFQESADGVVARLGEPGRPSTFRFVMRNEYEASLEDVVARNVPEDLDAALGRALLRPGEASPSMVNAVREWGPPEEKVRALIGVLGSKEPQGEAMRKAAIERLDAIGAAWNREEPFPAAPRFQGDLAAYVNAWKGWYRSMQRYPSTDL